MRILHAYCLNYNIGDYALGVGVKNLLRETFDVSLIGETNLQGRVFNEYYINEVVNKRYDLLVIGGGGIIHGAHWPNGWFWLIDQDLIKTIKIPFIVYGIGNNYFDGEEIPERAISHLQETYRHARYFSVRNDGSYERTTDQLGFRPEEVPDPGFHIPLNFDSQQPIREKYIIVQLANDKAERRFDFAYKDEFKQGLVKNLQRIAQSHKIIFAPHVIDDVELSREISMQVANSEVLNFGDFAFDHSAKMIAYYKYAEFVLAMRGHGQIIPIGFNVPVIALQNHPKHVGLMKKLDLIEFNVNVNEANFSDNLAEAIERLTANRDDLIGRYKTINAELVSVSRKAMELIKRSL